MTDAMVIILGCTWILITFRFLLVEWTNFSWWVLEWVLGRVLEEEFGVTGEYECSCISAVFVESTFFWRSQECFRNQVPFACQSKTLLVTYIESPQEMSTVWEKDLIILQFRDCSGVCTDFVWTSAVSWYKPACQETSAAQTFVDLLSSLLLF